jgi:hypothetical protein
MANRRVHRRSQSRAAPLESLQGDQFLDFRYNRVDRFPVPWSICGRSDGSLLFRVASAPRQRIRRAHGSNASDQMNCYTPNFERQSIHRASCSRLQLPGRLLCGSLGSLKEFFSTNITFGLAKVRSADYPRGASCANSLSKRGSLRRGSSGIELKFSVSYSALSSD